MPTREERTSAILEAFPPGSGVTEDFGGDQQTFRVTPSTLPGLARFLKDDPRLDCKMLLDVCGVDYPDRGARFEVVYHLYSLQHGHRLRHLG